MKHLTVLQMPVHATAAAGVLAMLSLCAAEPIAAAGYTSTYTTEFTRDLPDAVYKSVDGRGRVTYSSNWPKDTVGIEEIAIGTGPPGQYIEASRRRYEQISKAAQTLANAREKRQAEREEEEKKRLERLALQKSARPQVYERRVYVGWNPLWWSLPHSGRYHAPHRHSSHPQRPGLSRSRPLQPGRPLR